MYSPDGVLVDRFEIEYSEAVWGLYNTREIVEQKVSLLELSALAKSCEGHKSAFSHVANVRYNLGVEVSVCVYDLLAMNRVDLLGELLSGYGFVLAEVDAGSSVEKVVNGLCEASDVVADVGGVGEGGDSSTPEVAPSNESELWRKRLV